MMLYIYVSVLLIHFAQELTANNNDSLENNQNASYIFCMCLFIIFFLGTVAISVYFA